MDSLIYVVTAPFLHGTLDAKAYAKSNNILYSEILQTLIIDFHKCNIQLKHLCYHTLLLMYESECQKIIHLVK